MTYNREQAPQHEKMWQQRQAVPDAPQYSAIEGARVSYKEAGAHRSKERHVRALRNKKEKCTRPR